jgi:hypothetical protein
LKLEYDKDWDPKLFQQYLFENFSKLKFGKDFDPHMQDHLLKEYEFGTALAEKLEVLAKKELKKNKHNLWYNFFIPPRDWDLPKESVKIKPKKFPRKSFFDKNFFEQLHIQG